MYEFIDGYKFQNTKFLLEGDHMRTTCHFECDLILIVDICLPQSSKVYVRVQLGLVDLVYYD